LRTFWSEKSRLKLPRSSACPPLLLKASESLNLLDGTRSECSRHLTNIANEQVQRAAGSMSAPKILFATASSTASALESPSDVYNETNKSRARTKKFPAPQAGSNKVTVALLSVPIFRSRLHCVNC